MGRMKKIPDEMTFLEHLEELRKRLFYSILGIIIVFIPAWMFSKDVFNIIAIPVNKYLPAGDTLAFTALADPFFVYIKVAFLTALFVTSPFIFLQIWYFIAPGLFKKEKKYVFPFVIFTTFFFLLGAAFGFFVVFPFACRFFLKVGSEFQAVITLKQYLSLALRVILGIALFFELPTLVFFLSRMGIITAKFMIKNFKYAVLIVFIIAAIITPTPDIATQTIIAVPMLVLYGFSIFIALLFDRERKKKKLKKEEEKSAG